MRDLGRRKGDVWDRFDRLQRVYLPFREAKERGVLFSAFALTRISPMARQLGRPENQHRVREALLILPEKAIRELGADEVLQQ